MKQLSRLSIQRMIDTSGSAGSGGSGGNDISLAGYATEAWVEENYLSKDFFLRLFGIHGTDENDDPVDVEPNDPDTTITDIEAMFGFWTEKYISALGQGSGGGGGGSDTLADLIDVELTNPAAGQVLKYNGTKWVNSAASAGTVTSVGMSVPTGFTVTGSPITVSGVLGLSFAAGYSLPTTAKQTNWDAAYTWTSVSRTTLADYGITDAKFGIPGTDSIPITLGSTTQSVLTQHQSLANYYTKSETDGKFLTISFFRSLFKAYNSSDVEVQPNDGNTATITNIKAMFGFWTEQYISALGQSSGGGGGVTLNQPLLGINQAGLSAPTTAGLGLVFNGSAWVYTNAASMSVYGLTVSSTLQAYNAIFGSTVSGAAFSATGGGFSVSGKDNTYVLLAGGGTKLLSEIGGGGAVNSITLGQGGTNYTPDASGIITLPPYPSKTSDLTNDSGFITGYTDTKNTAGATNNTAISLYLVGAPSQTANPETYTRTGCYIDANGYLFSGGVKVLTSAVQSVVIGASGTPISPVNGVVTLPEYPTVTDTKNTAGATDLPSVKLYLIGANGQTANPQTYTNSGCYIGTDNCLYSGGSKVQTVASGYLPLSGGTLTNSNDILSLSSSSTNVWIYFKSTVSGTVSNRASVGYYNYFAFIANENTYARIGVADNGNPEYWPGSAGNTRYTLLHSGNYSNYFTNTKNTAGATNNTAISLYLVGAPSQSENPETYTRSGCYISSDGYLYSGGSKVLTSSGGLVTGISVDNSTPYTPTNGIVGLPVLRLSGGTLTNSDNILSLSSSSTNVWIYFKSTVSGTVSNRASVGYYNYFAFISNENTYARIGVADNGNPEYWPGSAGNTRYTLLHSGNYSNQISVINGTLTAGDLTIGGSATVNSVSCAVIQTNSSRGIYVKTGLSPNYVDGTWSNASDMRLKDIVSKIGGSVDDIANAPIFNFRWKAGGNQVMVGTSAQYWQNVLPNTVTQAFNGYLYMDYSAAAIAAAVITARKVQDHEGRLQILERENEALRREIQILKSA